MYARPYNRTQSDDETLDRLLDNNVGHDVRLDRDRLVVCDTKVGLVGLLVWRPGGIVHELITGRGLAQRSVADTMVKYAVNEAVAHPWHLHTALFVTDSDEMAQYAEALGAVEVVGKRIFQLELT